MDDKYFEHDADMPTEIDHESMYGSRFLSTGDIGDRKIRTKILKVRKEELRKDDGTKRWRLVLSFESLDKPLVVNATTKDLLVTTLGRVPAKWVGASVGIFVDQNVMYAGKRVGGVRLRVLEPAQAKLAPQPVAVKKPQPDDFDDNPDFNEAAE